MTDRCKKEAEILRNRRKELGLTFHLKDPPVHLTDNQFQYKDIDRFMFAPLEYIIIFEKTE